MPMFEPRDGGLDLENDQPWWEGEGSFEGDTLVQWREVRVRNLPEGTTKDAFLAACKQFGVRVDSRFTVLGCLAPSGRTPVASPHLCGDSRCFIPRLAVHPGDYWNLFVRDDSDNDAGHKFPKVDIYVNGHPVIFTLIRDGAISIDAATHASSPVVVPSEPARLMRGWSRRGSEDNALMTTPTVAMSETQPLLSILAAGPRATPERTPEPSPGWILNRPAPGSPPLPCGLMQR